MSPAKKINRHKHFDQNYDHPWRVDGFPHGMTDLQEQWRQGADGIFLHEHTVPAGHYPCTYPECYASFQIKETHGAARPVWNEYGEVVGWYHNREEREHATAIDPEFIIHISQKHPRDSKKSKERMKAVVDRAMYEHSKRMKDLGKL